MISYQGKKNLFFKEDFGSHFLENFKLEFLDYGFLWDYFL